MKLTVLQPPRFSRAGITLLECLIFIGVLTLVLGLGFVAFYRCLDNHLAVRRNADDISQALTAGEIWRADIRAATKPPVVDEDDTNPILKISTADGDIAYRFDGNKVERRAAADWQVLLPRVANSRMTAATRNHVVAWHWELELKASPHQTLIRPLFTFTAACPAR